MLRNNWQRAASPILNAAIVCIETAEFLYGMEEKPLLKSYPIGLLAFTRFDGINPSEEMR